MATSWYLEAPALPDLGWAALDAEADGSARVREPEGAARGFPGVAEAESYLTGRGYRAYEDLLWEGLIAPDLRTPESPVRVRAGGPALKCRRCGGEVKVHRADYETFERMHWLCFHLEFEHAPYDPDEPCQDPGCPWNQIRELKAQTCH